MKKELDLTTKRILLYLGITFVLTYAYEFLVIYPMVLGNSQTGSTATMTVGSAMFMPAFAVLLTRLITKEGFNNAGFSLNFKGNARIYLFSWFGPAVLTLLGTGIYFLIFPDKFDGSLTLLQSSFAAAGQEMTTDEIKSLLLVQLGMAFCMAPLMNALNCFGEEWGWRGYLLPKMMEKFSLGKVLLINGLIWGVWHAPLTVLGHNYGKDYFGYPVTGILAMCVFCIVMGVIFSYITIKTGSCIPAVLAHGSLNGIASFGIYFTKDGGNPFIGPAPTGIIGIFPFIIVAVVMVCLLLKKKPEH